VNVKRVCDHIINSVNLSDPVSPGLSPKPICRSMSGDRSWTKIVIPMKQTPIARRSVVRAIPWARFMRNVRFRMRPRQAVNGMPSRVVPAIMSARSCPRIKRLLVSYVQISGMTPIAQGFLKILKCIGIHVIASNERVFSWKSSTVARPIPLAAPAMKMDSCSMGVFTLQIVLFAKRHGIIAFHSGRGGFRVNADTI
jgi:hypothetical protein